MDIYCTRPNCARPNNSFPDLDTGGTLKTTSQRFCLHCGMPLILAGRYVTEKPLSRGGFGTTFIARDRYTPAMRRCVVKQLLPTGFSPQQMQKVKQMFDQEGEVLENLGTHPQIPDLLAFFPMEAGQDTFFYLVQEFIDGFTLEQIVEQSGSLTEAEIIEFMQSMLPVLQFIHEHQSIHRDIKPANIMIRKQDQKYFLLDFGAVKQITSATINQKSTGIFTPGFGAPEQMRGDTVFPSTDLYAFGVTCIYLLTGKEPEDLFDVHTNKWNWRSQLPPQSQISDRLANILDQMMESTPSHRFNSAQAVLDALNASIGVKNVTPPVPTSTLMSPTALPNPSPQPVVTPTSASVPAPKSVQSAPSPKPIVPSAPLVLPPLGKQLFAAFLLGFELMALGIVATSLGFSMIGTEPSLLILVGIMLTLVWLRVSSVLDNKDLVLFIALPTVLGIWGVKEFLNLAIKITLISGIDSSFPNIAILCAIAGFGAVAFTTLFRLVYQFLYSLL